MWQIQFNHSVWATVSVCTLIISAAAFARSCSLPSSWRSAPYWRCMLTSWLTPTCSSPSLLAPRQRSESFVLLSITWLPSTRAGRVLWPRNHTTLSWVSTFTVLGMCLRTMFDISGLLTVLVIQRPQPLLPLLGHHRGILMTAKETQTAIVFALWQSRCPTTHLYQASTVSAKKRGCVSMLISGQRASSWACLLVSPWLGKVRNTIIVCLITCRYFTNLT